MAHGGYGKRRVNPAGRRSKGLGVEKKPKPKPKSVSLKNQIRSIERMLRKDLPPEIQEKKLKELEQLKKQQEIHSRLAVERKIFLRDRKIKFFERRKVERRIRRLEKLQRASSGQAQDAEIAEQLSKLKEDLEYVRFFPKTEKYVSLFTGGDDSDVVDRRNKLRKQIKANLVAAAASGKDLEGTSVLSLGAAEVGLNPTKSKLEVVYARRVKDEISRQLLKNKKILAEVVADLPAEGYSKEVIRTMNFAPVVGLSWGGDDKRMLNLLSKIEREKRELAAPKVKGKRELKNLECSFNVEVSGQRSSQAKCQCRRGFLGSKIAYSFPHEVQ